MVAIKAVTASRRRFAKRVARSLVGDGEGESIAVVGFGAVTGQWGGAAAWRRSAAAAVAAAAVATAATLASEAPANARNR